MAETTIEWTASRLSDGRVLPGFTFNPWRGCTKVSQGCKHCYADTLSKRNPSALGVSGPKGTRVVAAEAYWKLPLKWAAEARREGVRRKVFCASLADVFEGDDTMPAEAWSGVEEARRRLWDLVERTKDELDWLVLTKRPENVINHRLGPMVPNDWLYDHDGFPRNVWIGTSVENQEAADERIPHLLQVPASVRFLSCEPLLGPVDISWVGSTPGVHHRPNGFGKMGYWGGGARSTRLDVSGLHWVIVGGESGHGARPMHPQWAQSLRDQCANAGVAFFFKQWGAELPKGQGAHGLDERGLFRRESHVSGQTYYNTGKHAAGRLLDGAEHNETPDA